MFCPPSSARPSQMHSDTPPQKADASWQMLSALAAAPLLPSLETWWEEEEEVCCVPAFSYYISVTCFFTSVTPAITLIFPRVATTVWDHVFILRTKANQEHQWQVLVHRQYASPRSVLDDDDQAVPYTPIFSENLTELCHVLYRQRSLQTGTCYTDTTPVLFILKAYSCSL